MQAIRAGYAGDGDVIGEEWEMNDVSSKIAQLEQYGFTVGKRDPRVNSNYAGRFMVIEPHDETELPTEDDSNGPWAIVGDDLTALVNEAYEFAEDVYAKAEQH